MRRGGRAIVLDGGGPRRWRASGRPASRRGGRARGGATDTLTIGAYSVVREAFHDGDPAGVRRASGSGQTGRTVRFEESYNGSGAQSRAIASGFDADVAVLSLEGDVDRLVKAGLVKKDWNAGPGPGDDHAEPGRHRRPRRATRRGSATGPTWPGPASASSTPTRRPPAGPAGTSTRSTARGCSARPAASPTPRPPATSWRGSRPTWSTWTPRAGRAWRPSSAGPATRSSPTRTSCSSARS